MRAILLAALMLLASPPLLAETPDGPVCAALETIDDALRRAGAERIAGGIIEDGVTMAIYATRADGRWIMVFASRAGNACIVRRGIDWRSNASGEPS